MPIWPSPALEAVERAAFRIFAQCRQPLLQLHAHLPCEDRHRDIFRHVFGIAALARGPRGEIAEIHQRGRVRGARGHAQHYRCAVLLGNVEGGHGHVVGFLAVRRFEERHFGKAREKAIVLLILRAVHARVVGGDDHQPAVAPDIGKGHQRVGGHVQPHVLHGGERARPGEGSADHHFHGHLLVDRPFAVNPLLEFGDVVQNFRAGRARIGRGHPASRLECPMRDRLIAGKETKLFCHVFQIFRNIPAPRGKAAWRIGIPKCTTFWE